MTDNRFDNVDWLDVARRKREMSDNLLQAQGYGQVNLDQEDYLSLLSAGRGVKTASFLDGALTNATGQEDWAQVLPFLGAISEEVDSDRLEDSFDAYINGNATREQLRRINAYLDWQETVQTSASRIGAMSGQVFAFMGETALTGGLMGGVGLAAKGVLAARRAQMMSRLTSIGVVGKSISGAKRFGAALKASPLGRSGQAVVNTTVGKAIDGLVVRPGLAIGRYALSPSTIATAAGQTAGKEAITQIGGAVAGIINGDDAGYGAGRIMNAAHLRYLADKYQFDASEYGIEAAVNNDVTLLEYVPREILNQFIENWTEQVGGSLTEGIAAANKVFNVKFLDRAIAKYAKGEGLEAGAKRVFDRIAATGYNGFIQENFEEVMGATAKQAIGMATGDEELSRTYEEFWTTENWTEMAAGIALGSTMLTTTTRAGGAAFDTLRGGASGRALQQLEEGRKTYRVLADAANEARNEDPNRADDAPQANLWTGNPDVEGQLRRALYDGALYDFAAQEAKRRTEAGEQGVPTPEEILEQERAVLDAKYGSEATQRVQDQIASLNNLSPETRDSVVADLLGGAAQEGEVATPTTEGEPTAEAAPEVAPEAADTEGPQPTDAPETDPNAAWNDKRVFDEDPERPGELNPVAEKRDEQFYTEAADALENSVNYNGAPPVPYSELSPHQRRLVNTAVRNNKELFFVDELPEGVAAVHLKSRGTILLHRERAASQAVLVQPDGGTRTVQLSPQQSIEANFLHEGFHRMVKKYGKRFMDFMASSMDKAMPGVRAKNEAIYQAQWNEIQQQLPEDQRRELTQEELLEEGIARTIESFVAEFGALSARNDIQTFERVLMGDSVDGISIKQGLVSRIVEALENGVRAALFIGPRKSAKITRLRQIIDEYSSLDTAKLSDEAVARRAVLAQNLLEAWRGAAANLDQQEGTILGWRQDIAEQQAPKVAPQNQELEAARAQLADLEDQLSKLSGRKKNKMTARRRKKLRAQIRKVKERIKELEDALPVEEPPMQGPPVPEQPPMQGPPLPMQGPQLPLQGPPLPVQGPPMPPAPAPVTPGQAGARRATIASQVAGIDNEIARIERRRAAYANRTDARSRRLVEGYSRDIAELLRQRSELEQRMAQLDVQGPPLPPPPPLQGPPLPDLPTQGPPTPPPAPPAPSEPPPLQGPPTPVGPQLPVQGPAQLTEQERFAYEQRPRLQAMDPMRVAQEAYRLGMRGAELQSASTAQQIEYIIRATQPGQQQGPPAPADTSFGPQQPPALADMSYRELQLEAKQRGVKANQKRDALVAALEAARQNLPQPQQQQAPQAQATQEAPVDLDAESRAMGEDLGFAQTQEILEDLGFESITWSELEQELEDKQLQEELSPSEQQLLDRGPWSSPGMLERWMQRDEQILVRRNAERSAQPAETDPANDAQHNLPTSLLGGLDENGQPQFNIVLPANLDERRINEVLESRKLDIETPIGELRKKARAAAVHGANKMSMASALTPQQRRAIRQAADDAVVKALNTGIAPGFGGRDGSDVRRAFRRTLRQIIDQLDLPGQTMGRKPGLMPTDIAESLAEVSDFATADELLQLMDTGFDLGRKMAASRVSRADIAAQLADQNLDPAVIDEVHERVTAVVRDEINRSTAPLINAAVTAHAISVFRQASPTILTAPMAQHLSTFFAQRALGMPGTTLPISGASAAAFDVTQQADRRALMLKFTEGFKDYVKDPKTGEPMLMLHTTRALFRGGVASSKESVGLGRDFMQFTRLRGQDVPYQLHMLPKYFLSDEKIPDPSRPGVAQVNPNTGQPYTGREILGAVAVMGYNKKGDLSVDADRLEVFDNYTVAQFYRGDVEYSDDVRREMWQEVNALMEAATQQGTGGALGVFGSNDYGQPILTEYGLSKPTSEQEFERATDVSYLESSAYRDEWDVIFDDSEPFGDLFTSEAIAEAYGLGFEFAYNADLDGWSEYHDKLLPKVKAWLAEPGAFVQESWWRDPRTEAWVNTMRYQTQQRRFDGDKSPLRQHKDWPKEMHALANKDDHYNAAEKHEILRAARRAGFDLLTIREATREGTFFHYTALDANKQAKSVFGEMDLDTQAMMANLQLHASQGTDAAPFAPKPKSALDNTTPRAAVAGAYTEPVNDPTGRVISKTLGIVPGADEGVQYIADLQHEDQAPGVFAVEAPIVPESMRSATAQHMLHHAMLAGAEHISVEDADLAAEIARMSGATVLDDGLIRLDTRVYNRAGAAYDLGRMKQARNRKQRMFGRQLWSDNDMSFNLGTGRDSRPAPKIDADPNTKVDYERASAMLSTHLARMDRNVHYTNLRSQQHEQQLVSMLPPGATEQEKAAHVKRMGRAIHLWIDLKGNDRKLTMREAVAEFREKAAAKGMAISEQQEETIQDALSLDGEALALAHKIADENHALGVALKRMGLIGNAREFYSARLWFLDAAAAESRDFSDPATAAVDPTRPGGRFLRTVGGRAKARVYNSILDGWLDGRQLSIDNAIVAQHKVHRDAHEAMANSAFAKALEASQAIVRVGPGERVPEGMKQIRSNSRSFDSMYASPALADELGALTTRFSWEGLGRLGKPARAVYNLQARAKSTLLFTSLFHHQAFMRSYFYSVPTAVDQLGDVGTIGLASLQSLISPTAANATLMRSKAARAGWEAIMTHSDDIDMLVSAGLTLSLGMEYSTKAEVDQNWRRTWVESLVGFASEGAAQRLADHRVASSNWLFSKMGSSLKAQAALLEYAHMKHENKADLEAGRITEAQIAEIVAEKTNDDFGGLNLRRGNQIAFGPRRPGAQLVLRTLFLAPDWTESNFNTVWKAFRPSRTAADDEKLADMQTTAYVNLYKQAIVRSQVPTLIFNALMAGLDDEETLVSMYARAFNTSTEKGIFGVLPTDFNFMKADVTVLANAIDEMFGTDRAKHAGSRVYFSVMGHFMDPLNWASGMLNVDIMKPLKAKLGPLARLVAAAGTGEDWRGMTYTPIDEIIEADDQTMLGWRLNLNKWEFGAGKMSLAKVPSFLVEQVSNNLPIVAQSGFRLMAGEDSAFDFLADSMGFHITRDYDRPSGGSASRASTMVGSARSL